jgi:fumarate hydratase subunit alpha
MVPLCQDTGLAVVFVDMGTEVLVSAPADRPGSTILDAIQDGVRLGYQRGLLRKSVVADPLYDRRNTGTNTPAIIHLTVMPGDKVKISLMAKGTGCENKSQFKVFNPTVQTSQIVEWIVSAASAAGADACPPLIVGVGIGGDMEQCCLMAKKALLRPLDQPNSDPRYADLEQQLLTLINDTGLGPQGMGGDTTALAVLVEAGPCHIASLPVAVNIECHSHRHASCTI